MSRKNLILFDDDNWKYLLPLTYTRPVSELRVGILTIKEKWEIIYGCEASYITQDHLSEKYPVNLEDDNLLINSACLPTEKLKTLISDLKLNEAILCQDEFIAARLDKSHFVKLVSGQEIEEINGIDIANEISIVKKISKPYHIFQYNDVEIKEDYIRLTDGRTSEKLSETNKVIGENNVFVEPGAEVEFSIINASKGPVYIGRNATIMEGSMIRGPFALCEGGVIKMGAKIYESTTIGPYCKVGGEISNVVFFANSNKAHDGYLGNSVIGEWCNIGADTNASNLKNNYDEVKLWSYPDESFVKTGLQFCGLIMADHSKCGINTMFNTGTVVGVCTNIFGDGYPRNFIPSYAWGGNSGFITQQFKKAMETAKIVMERRSKVLTNHDVKILEFIFFESAKYRSWEI